MYIHRTELLCGVVYGRGVVMTLVLFVLFLALKVIAIQSSLLCVQCDRTVTCNVTYNGALVCVAPSNCPVGEAMNCTNEGGSFDCVVDAEVINVSTLIVRYRARALCGSVNANETECELNGTKLRDTCRCQESVCNRRVVIHRFTTLVPIYPTPVLTVRVEETTTPVPSTVRVEETAVGETSVVAGPSIAPESTFVAGELKPPSYSVLSSHNLTSILTLLHVKE